MRLTTFTDFALRALMRLAGEPTRSFHQRNRRRIRHLAHCVLTPRCRLKAKLAAAREAFMRELDATTLAECAYPATPRR
jgi:DNA-binding IscR family transcriptional regulator